MDIAIIGSEANSNWRSMQYIGDNMEPMIEQRDHVTVEIMETFCGDGVYLLEMFGGISIYRAQRDRDTVYLTSDNPRYGRRDIGATDFNDHVLARVIGVWKPVS